MTRSNRPDSTPADSRSADAAGDQALRVYLPATTTILRELLVDRALPAGATAFAVTSGLRAWYGDDDLDELEYAALLAAARASLRLLDADPAAARRRVVIAADLPASVVEVHDELDRGVVRLQAPVPLAAIASVHVDGAEARDTVARAAAVMLEADLGSATAQESVDDAEGFELSWYASQELEPLLALL